MFSCPLLREPTVWNLAETTEPMFTWDLERRDLLKSLQGWYKASASSRQPGQAPPCSARCRWYLCPHHYTPSHTQRPGGSQPPKHTNHPLAFGQPEYSVGSHWEGQQCEKAQEAFEGLRDLKPVPDAALPSHATLAAL